jgi:vancomycin resistance protein YoaR
MKQLLFATLVLICAAAGRTAHAEVLFARGEITPEPTSMTLLFLDKNIPVPAVTENSWKGSGELENYFFDVSPFEEGGFSALYAGQADYQKLVSPEKTFVSDYNPGAIYQFLKIQTRDFATAPIEPVLQIKDNRAVSFTAPQNGYTPNLYTSTFKIIDALRQNATSTELAVSTSTPLMELGQTNTLGIQELIAEGTSNFKGSPSNRRWNIKVGVEKMTGIIIAPGEEFSFNKFLGEVDGKHGFLPELVIKATGTVPEFGGGLCQVSSTTFRAAMQAGFPITQRRNHAYAVQYYAPQGTDATIYPGVIDLKFINDSPNSILIWPHFPDKDNLVFDFYGTKDDRQVTLEKPVQYDKQSSGAMKATWTREMTKNGTTTTDTFKSVYASPALYHKTETFPTTTPITGIHVGT